MEQLKNLQIIQKIVQGLILLAFLLPFSIPSCNKSPFDKFEKKSKRDSTEIADSLAALSASLVDENGKIISSPDSSYFYNKLQEEFSKQENKISENNYSITSSNGNLLNFDTKAVMGFLKSLLFSEGAYSGLGLIFYQFNVIVFFGVFIPFTIALVCIALLFTGYSRSRLRNIYILSIISIPLSLFFLLSLFQEIQYGFWITLILWGVNVLFLRSILKMSKSENKQ